MRKETIWFWLEDDWKKFQVWVDFGSINVWAILGLADFASLLLLTSNKYYGYSKFHKIIEPMEEDYGDEGILEFAFAARNIDTGII